MDAKETIMRIAEISESVAWQAGVGGCETAGGIISYLAAHPDKIDTLLKDGLLAVMDELPEGARDMHAHGRLTWHRKDGKVTTPQDLRISMTVRDLAKPIS